jgi:hypothetical protein
MDINKKLFLIQGIFFYESTTPGVGYRPGIGEVMVMRDGKYYSLFNGIIAPIIGDETQYGGNLSDYFGQSTISDVRISDRGLSFNKKYNDSEKIIKYTFKKMGELYIGSYKGQKIKGIARCILNEINEEFFADEDGNKPQ